MGGVQSKPLNPYVTLVRPINRKIADALFRTMPRVLRPDAEQVRAGQARGGRSISTASALSLLDPIRQRSGC
jgi:hypothetical protein